jgi:steroid delta-isomerase-like uncharacterized protein
VVPRPVYTLNGDDESTMNLSSGTSENSVKAKFKELLQGEVRRTLLPRTRVNKGLVALDVFNHPAVPEHQHGTDGFKHVIEWVRDIGPDTHYGIDDIISEGDKVAVRMTMSGTHTGTLKGIPPTGKRFSVDYVHWFRLAEGKVAELWAVRDDLTRLQQLGLIPLCQASRRKPAPHSCLNFGEFLFHALLG